MSFEELTEGPFEDLLDSVRMERPEQMRARTLGMELRRFRILDDRAQLRPRVRDERFEVFVAGLAVPFAPCRAEGVPLRSSGWRSPATK